MAPGILLTFIIGYFLVLLVISLPHLAQTRPDNDAFFVANRNSKWYLVAFGMIGTALSGVTFISVPGKVGAISGDQFSLFPVRAGQRCRASSLSPRCCCPCILPHEADLYLQLHRKHALGTWSYKTAAGIFPTEPHHRLVVPAVPGGYRAAALHLRSVTISRLRLRCSSPCCLIWSVHV
jgi:hypothetical protein